MRTHQAVRVGRLVGAFATLAGLVIVVPALMMWASRERFGSGNPLSGVHPPWNWNANAVLAALRDPLTDDLVTDLIVRTCLVAAWVSILLIVATTVLETVHLIRHRGLPMPSIRGLGWAQRVAQFIATGLLVLASLSPRASMASVETLATSLSAHSAIPFSSSLGQPVTDGSPPDGGPIDLRADTRSGRNAFPNQSAADVDDHGSASATVHVVERGQSIYSIAQMLSTDRPMTVPDIADAILDANLGNEMASGRRFTNPAYIEIGWKLIIPSEVGAPHVDRPHDRVVATPDTVTTSPGRDDTSDRATVTHVVIDGDTLSAIADQHLGDADRWPTVWAANAGNPMVDGRRFTDPNFILPGWQLLIPLDGPDEGIGGAATTPEEAPDRISTSTTNVPETRTTVAPSDPTAMTNSSDHVLDLVTSVSSAAVPTTIDASVDTIDRMPTGGEPLATDRHDIAPARPLTLRIEHAAVLASGLLALLGFRRHRRLRSAGRRAHLPQPRPEAVSIERRLRMADAGERVLRTDVAVRAAAHVLVGGDVRIGLVLVDRHGTIDIQLTEPGGLPPPWTGSGTPAGTRWTLDGSVPVEQLAESARRVGNPCVGLVQLGVSDDRDVLIDLEACGTLAVEDASGTVITAIATGLASSPSAEVAHLVTVAPDAAALLEHRNSHSVASAAEAVDLIASLVGSTMTNERTTFSLRTLHTGAEAWEPAILILPNPDDDDLAKIDAAVPGAAHGLAVVAAVQPGGWVTAEARLARGDEGWHLEVFGSSVPLVPVGVTPAELGEIVDVLDGNAMLSLADERLSLEDEEPVPAAAVDGPFVPVDHEIVVRLMGSVDVVSRTGTSGSFERSKTVELIAWMATHREKSTRNAARTALWELDVRDATFANVVSEARRALARLVAPPEGNEWVARTLNEQLPLHAAVVTDAELIDDRRRAARSMPAPEAIDTLRPAVEMIRDLPFAGTSYLWPDGEGITSSLIVLATGVAAELAERALQLGDTELVFWATGRGLAVLPGHEELIGLRMRAHAQAGDLAGVRQEWTSYERVINADTWSDGEPSPKLLDLRRELLR